MFELDRVFCLWRVPMLPLFISGYSDFDCIFKIIILSLVAPLIPLTLVFCFCTDGRRELPFFLTGLVKIGLAGEPMAVTKGGFFFSFFSLSF